MRRSLTILLALAVCAGCSPKLQPSERTEVRTTYRERIVHDTMTVSLPPAIEDRTVTTESHSHLENEWASSDASVDSLGRLHHSLSTRPHKVPIPVAVPVQDTLHAECHIETVTLTEYVEKPLKWYQESLMWLGAALLLVITALLARLIFKLIK